VFYNKNWDKKKKEKNGKQSDEEMCGDIDATDAAAVDTNEQITAMVSLNWTLTLFDVVRVPVIMLLLINIYLIFIYL